MPPQPALEAVLPELGEPGVPQVGVGLQVQVVIVEPGHVRRLQLDGDPASRLPLVAISHIVPVGPAVTEQETQVVRVRRLCLFIHFTFPCFFIAFSYFFFLYRFFCCL